MRTPKPFNWASRRSTVTCPWTCCISTKRTIPEPKWPLTAAARGEGPLRLREGVLRADAARPGAGDGGENDLRRQDQILHDEGLEAAAPRACRGLDDQGSLLSH